ncbi:hypothetical protein JXA88_09915 [Candidatus Fermentibacteria bacterium]|nr:hypothetical protein [Candidatus Fermentibacteria bacterium]
MYRIPDAALVNRRWLLSRTMPRMIARGLVAGVALSAVLVSCGGSTGSAEPKGVLPVELDTAHSFLILATEAAAAAYGDAIQTCRRMHSTARIEYFRPEDLASVESLLREHEPYYVQLFMMPHELDVNFNWRWLAMTAGLDTDPFVDTRAGIITGATPDDAARFVERILRATSGELLLPATMVDNLGPNPQVAPGSITTFPTSYFLPALGASMGLKGISHGAGYQDQWLDAMSGAGIIHLGGHGHPDGIDDGMTASQARRATLDPCVVFSGVCYTGVCGVWFDMYGSENRVVLHMTDPSESFCLQLLGNNVIGYLAALHPDHGIPVYQEMEFMAHLGSSLGEVMKHSYDGVVLGRGGELPEFEFLTDGMPSPRWTPAEIMLHGTASRVLFGDPSLRITKALDVPAPLRVTTERRGSALIVGGIMNNPEYKATFTDPFHDYLAFQRNMFNDRMLLSVPLAAEDPSSSSVRVLGAANGPRRIEHRLQGWGIEHDAGGRVLHVQVDLASTGYMQSEWRTRGAAVGIEALP